MVLHRLRRALRERDALRHALATAAVVALLAALSDEPLRSFLPLAAVLAGMGALDVLDDLYALPDGTKPGVVGGGLAVLALGWLAVDGVTWPPVAALAVGGWIALDGYETYRNGPVERPRGPYLADVDDGDTGDAIYRMQVAGRVAQAVRERPRTPAGVADELGLSEAHARDVLETLAARDHVVRDGDTYRARDAPHGRLTPVVRFARWLPRRLARPFVR